MVVPLQRHARPHVQSLQPVYCMGYCVRNFPCKTRYRSKALNWVSGEDRSDDYSAGGMSVHHVVARWKAEGESAQIAVASLIGSIPLNPPHWQSFPLQLVTQRLASNAQPACQFGLTQPRIHELHDLRMQGHHSSDVRTYNLGGMGGNFVCSKPVEAKSPCRSSRLPEVFDPALHTQITPCP